MREEPGFSGFFCYTIAMEIIERTSGIVSTCSYLVKDSGKIYLIDAPDSNKEIIDLIKKEGRLDGVFLTHGHFDHIMGLENIYRLFPNTPIYLDKADLDLVESKNIIFLQSFGIPTSLYSIPKEIKFTQYPEKVGSFSVINTPGHTMGSVVLYAKDYGIAFTGDTLFCGGEGRTDLGGNYLSLVSSLKKILHTLDEKTVLYPGHGGYTTIKREKERLF